MFTTWIVVGHRAGARIFEHRREQELELVSELKNDAGRLRNQDIDSDGPGRSFERKSVGRHAVGGFGGTTPHEHVAENFARELAQTLQQARSDNRFAHLVLVAEPHFLGLLRAALDHVTATTVSASVSKDLAKAELPEIRERLAGTLFA